MPDSRTNLIKKPWGIVVPIAVSSTSTFKTPIGWVFEDLAVSGISTLDVNISASPDRNLGSYQEYALADLQGKSLPFALDFASGNLYPSSSMVMEWRNIGDSEFQSVQLKNTSPWSPYTYVFWGVLIPQPRCFT